MESAKNFNLMQALKENGIYVVLLVLLMIIVIKEPSFLSLTNLSNILTQSSVRVIIALGVAGIIITQGTDLSAGRQVGLAALIAATMLQALTNVNMHFPINCLVWCQISRCYPKYQTESSLRPSLMAKL